MLTWELWRSKSEASLLAARNSLSAGDLAAAVSRAYFASFQAVTCALVKSGHQPPVDTGNWGHAGTQKLFLSLIRRETSKRDRLFAARPVFRELNRARARADYDDDSILSADDAEKLVREAGQIVALMHRLIDDGDI